MIDHLAPAEPSLAPIPVKRWHLPAILVAAILTPIVLGLALVGGWAYHRFGSWGVTAAFIRGETLVIEPIVIDMGTFQPGEVKRSTVWVHNLTGEEFRINGAKNYCAEKACVTVMSQFPLAIAPWTKSEVLIELEANSPERHPEGPFRYETNLHTQSGSRSIAIVGKVVGTEISSSEFGQ